MFDPSPRLFNESVYCSLPMTSLISALMQTTLYVRQNLDVTAIGSGSNSPTSTSSICSNRDFKSPTRSLHSPEFTSSGSVIISAVALKIAIHSPRCLSFPSPGPPSISTMSLLSVFCQCEERRSVHISSESDVMVGRKPKSRDQRIPQI
jgi:hypothetical protein